MDDSSIIELYFGRDEQAIRETAAKYGALCFRVANNILGCREDAEELGRVIGTFLKTQSADARCVFVRRYWNFDKVSDIEKRYSFGESKVKSQLSRTRGRLKKFLIEEGYNI